jgi:hypothetical protein
VAEAPAQQLGEPAEQGVQDAGVVGVGGEGVGHPVLGAHLRRQDRPGIDATGLGPEGAALAAEHRVQVGLVDDGDVAD